MDVCLLQETKLNQEGEMALLSKWRQWHGTFVDAKGASRDIGILWNPRKVQMEVLVGNMQW